MDYAHFSSGPDHLACCRRRSGGLAAVRDIFFVVRQQSAAIVQRFGMFVRVAHPGLNMKSPIEAITGHVSLRVAQLEVSVETKTEDNVFVHLNRLRAIPGKVGKSVRGLLQA